MKKSFVAIAFLSTLAIGSHTASAATGLCYYDTNSTYSSTFANYDGTVVLNGWQTNDAPLRFIPSIKYSVVTRSFIGSDTLHGSTTITGDYPQSGSWYSYIFSNIPAKDGMSIKVETITGYNTRGAGNAY